MLNLYLLVPAAIVLVPFVVVTRAVIAYLQDPKGFRKYPAQNYLSAFTQLGYCWELGRKHPVIHSRRLYLDHSTKGHKVIRLGPNWISFGRARAARDIYGFTSSAKKSALYDQLSGGGGAHLANISDKSLHKFRRSMVSHYYAPKHQRHWEESWVLDSCADFMKAIDAKCTKPMGPYEQPNPADLTLDLVHWGYTYACEVMIKIGLSKDLHLLDKGNNNIEIEDSDGSKREISIVQSLHCAGRAAANVIWDTKRFTTWVKLMNKVSKEYAHNLKGGSDWHAAMTKLVLERMDRHRKGEMLDDLFMPWMEGKDGNEPDISTRDRIAEIEQMVGAAIDAPGGSVATTIYNLVKDPRTFQKLRQELDAGLPPHRAVATWQQVKNMPYLKACIDEAMRLHPPVATDLVRRTPPEGMVIDGVPVPGNTDISISAYTSHRDPTVFASPEKWYPDRWTENRGTELMKDMLASWIPFSAGYRTCMGRNVSIVIQACVIGTLVHNYDFALPSNDWELPFEEWFNLWPTQCPVKVWKRERFAQSQPAA
ncbi:cytochrome P450 [Aspergillus ambiguus]|uniref:cytochrome P450 n=1 Tax=Aspergillus ambiguus TaxID=176160 RepID=UPI003CCCA0AF